MKKIRLYVLAFAFVLAVAASACYAMGVFGADSTVKVSDKEYAGGIFTYSGELRNGRFDGEGTLNFQTGDKFSGNFTDGRINGNGVFFGREGWRFEGGFEDCEVFGGTLVLEDGSTEVYKREADADRFESAGWQYDGNFGVRGQDGIGTFTFADGSVYFGGFSRGMANGEGVYTDASGKTVYEGEFNFGVFEGQGIYYNPEGWSYEGGFKDGLFDGEGAVTLDGQTIHGVWEKGGQIKRYE